MRIATVLMTILAATSVCFAQSPDEAAARAAEQAGRYREALGQYVAALQKTQQGSADETRLRESAVAVAKQVIPAVPVPEEARRFMVRGATAIKEAKTSADFEQAAGEFALAGRVAPWWPDPYFNQGVALEKAGKLPEAIRAFRTYLSISPDSVDAGKVKDQIYALEFRHEKGQKDSAAEQQRATAPSRLAGDWCLLDRGAPNCNSRRWIEVRGSNVELWMDWGERFGGRQVWARTIANGDELAGAYLNAHNHPCPMAESALRGKIRPDGNVIELDLESLMIVGRGCPVVSRRNFQQTWVRKPAY